MQFKTRKEVEKFFITNEFRFIFMSEGMAYFKTLKPKENNKIYYDFELCFYVQDNDFFNYSSFETWFQGMQLSEVISINTETNKRNECYFEMYLKK
jgi:hypothetical protein